MDTRPLRPNVPWTAADGVRALLLALAVYGAVFLFRLSVGGRLGDAELTDLGRLGITLGLVIFQSTLFLPVWIWGLRKYGVGPAALGFRGFHPAHGCRTLLLVLIGSYLAIGLWGLLLQRYGLRAQPNIPNLLGLFGEGARGLALALLVVGVVAPLTEETFFRGFLFPALRKRYGVTAGIVASAIIFALFHLQPLAIPSLFALGVFLALLYHQTGSVWPGILLHATINSVSVLALFAARQMGIPLS